MPNHVTNRLRFCDPTSEAKVGDDIFRHICKVLQGNNPEQVIDFNELIRMPDGYIDDGRWYDWACQNWGTKWNAYDSSRDDYGKELTFLTAWSHPEPVVQEISRRFPDVLIRHGWADEDVGYNVGEMTWLGGKCIDENIPSGGSQDALKLFADIMDESLEDYGYEYVNGRWIFEEER